MSKKKSDIDRVIAENDEKIRTLVAVNDALKAVQEAKRKLRKQKPMTLQEAKQA